MFYAFTLSTWPVINSEPGGTSFTRLKARMIRARYSSYAGRLPAQSSQLGLPLSDPGHVVPSPDRLTSCFRTGLHLQTLDLTSASLPEHGIALWNSLINSRSLGAQHASVDSTKMLTD